MTSCPLKIFIVENHDDTLTYLVRYLKGCGHDVQSAKSMTSALEIMPALHIDVLISDIGLPDGDGWQLMERIGEMKMPVPFAIAMSGYGRRSDQETSQKFGYRHHLIKPFLPEELDVLLDEAIEQVRQK